MAESSVSADALLKAFHNHNPASESEIHPAIDAHILEGSGGFLALTMTVEDKRAVVHLCFFEAAALAARLNQLAEQAVQEFAKLNGTHSTKKKSAKTKT